MKRLRWGRIKLPKAERSIICGMVKPFIQPVRRRRGNPNWGRPLPPAPAVATEFETQVRHCRSSGSESYALSPINFSGSSSRKLPGESPLPKQVLDFAEQFRYRQSE